MTESKALFIDNKVLNRFPSPAFQSLNNKAFKDKRIT